MVTSNLDVPNLTKMQVANNKEENKCLKDYGISSASGDSENWFRKGMHTIVSRWLAGRPARALIYDSSYFMLFDSWFDWIHGGDGDGDDEDDWLMVEDWRGH